MLLQQLHQLPSPVAVIDRANRQAALARIDAGIRIGSVLEKQLGNFVVIAATSVIERSSLRGSRFRLVQFRAVIEQQLHDVQVTFPRRVSERVRTGCIRSQGQFRIAAEQLADPLLIADRSRYGQRVLRTEREQSADQDGRIPQRRVRPAARGAIPIVGRASDGELYRLMSIRPPRVDWRAETNELWNELELARDDAPVQRAIS